jgi:hypothetical protein
MTPKPGTRPFIPCGIIRSETKDFTAKAIARAFAADYSFAGREYEPKNMGDGTYALLRVK